MVEKNDINRSLLALLDENIASALSCNQVLVLFYHLFFCYLNTFKCTFIGTGSIGNNPKFLPVNLLLTDYYFLTFNQIPTQLIVSSWSNILY
jgi:hypothetical protein